MIEINPIKFLTIFSLSGMLTILLSLPSGIFVLSKNPAHPVNRSWFLFCISVTIWGFGVTLIPTATNPDDAIVWWKIAHVGAINIPIFFSHLVCRFLHLKKPIFLWLAYLSGGIFSGLLLTDFFITNAAWSFNSFYYNNRPPSFAYKFFIVFWFSCVIYPHYLLFKNLNGASERKKTQIKYFLFAMCTSYAGGATCFLPILGFDIYPYGNLLTPFYPLVVSYAIVKHQLMDIQIVIRKSLIYSLLITVITLSYLLFVIGLEHMIQHFWGYESKVISIIVAFVLGLFIIPLRNRIQHIVDKTLFRRSHSEMVEENQRLRQEVTQTERLRTVATLASGMAHEIKNPLTAIKIFAEYLPAKVNDKTFTDKFIPLVQHEVSRIDDLVHQLLEYAKPTPPNIKAVNIIVLINDTLDFLSQKMISQRIKLVKNFSLPENTQLNIDANQIKQALLNIILNAIDAMPSGGQLTVTIEPQPSAVHIHIHDNGSGISEKDVESIFDPFYSKKDDGTGLGLSITHEIIQQHGGEINVESKKGEGTVFEIVLPLKMTSESDR